MHIPFICPYWGKENISTDTFVMQAVANGYDGLEVNVPTDTVFELELMHAVQQNGLFLIAQQWLPPANETVADYIKRFEKSLYQLSGFYPKFINSHTGKDFFSFDDNCRIIEAAENISQKTGVPIVHETHRGRFTFHAYTLLQYLEKFPGLSLTADFSHWCTVSESLLEDQADIVQQIIPRVHYIQARIGYEQGPQVPDPKGPGWKQHVNAFDKWWDAIITHNISIDTAVLPICPEFGPVPYMPAEPFTQKPLSYQWNNNIWMKNRLKERYKNV
jgi:sugar phosphate isomerase/epimerase